MNQALKLNDTSGINLLKVDKFMGMEKKPHD